MPSAALPRFVLLYAAMYAAYGVASPFLPAFLGARGLTPGELGLALGAWGLDAIVWQQAALLCVAALAALLVPEPMHRRIAENPPADVGTPPTSQAAGSFRTLLRIPMFRNLVLAAALILGSHAMHDVFAVIRWN